LPGPAHADGFLLVISAFPLHAQPVSPPIFINGSERISGDPERREMSMIDLNVQILLEKAINSRTKLQLLQIFYENPSAGKKVSELVQRCCRDLWSVRDALDEMAEDGILVIGRTVGGEQIYYYSPTVEDYPVIEELMRSYDDPLERDTIFHMVHEFTELTFLHTPFDRRPL
jgi:hypothetical protein